MEMEGMEDIVEEMGDREEMEDGEMVVSSAHTSPARLVRSFRVVGSAQAPAGYTLVRSWVVVDEL